MRLAAPFAPLVPLALLTLCAFGAYSGASHAADTATATTKPGDSLVVGLGVAYVPEYAGSDDSRAVPLPFLERNFSNGFFISTRRGLGYQTNVGDINLSGALTYGGGRAEHKRTFGAGSDALRGMGEIDGAPQAVLSASYRLGTVGLSLGTTQNLRDRDNGATYTVGASMPLYRSATDQLGLGVSAVYGDDKHAQTYFGVTAAQSLRSGYRAYQAKGGFETVSASLSWDRAIDQRWSVHSALSVSTLTGDAADSPLTRRKTTPMLMTGFSYKF